MRLKNNWRKVLVKAWSSRFMLFLIIFSGIVTGVEAFLPLAWELGAVNLPHLWYPVLVLTVTSIALIARLLVQAGITYEPDN